MSCGFTARHRKYQRHIVLVSDTTEVERITMLAGIGLFATSNRVYSPDSQDQMNVWYVSVTETSAAIVKRVKLR